MGIFYNNNGLSLQTSISHKEVFKLAMLINVMLGHMADELLSSVLVPIPKDPNGSLTTSDDYRPIALFSASGKLIDMLIMNRYSESLMTSNLQFAFKKGHSTSMGTTVVRGSILP